MKNYLSPEERWQGAALRLVVMMSGYVGGYNAGLLATPEWRPSGRGDLGLSGESALRNQE